MTIVINIVDSSMQYYTEITKNKCVHLPLPCATSGLEFSAAVRAAAF